MPKKAIKRRKRKSSKKKPGIAVFLIAGVICAAIIWYISSSPGKKADKVPQPDEKPLVQKKAAREEEKQAETAEEPTAKDPETLLKLALQKLGVPSASAVRRKYGNEVSLKVPIDRSRMDLTFANMIIKSELERGGATFVKGEEKGGKQSMEFTFNDLTYRINLYYDSAPYSAADGKRYIAIVVDDFGTTSGELLAGFMDLPQEITFAIFPDMVNSVDTMNRAYEQGRETLIHVPMEPIDFPRVNPGKNPILVQMSEANVNRLIGGYLNKMPHCMGINNHMGSLATTDPDVMGYVMNSLKGKDKIFLDSRTSNVSVAYQVAQKAQITAYRNDVFLDSPDVSAANMDKKIKQIVALGSTKKNIIAITHCHSLDKLEYLKEFIKRIEAEGFILVPLSRLGKYDVPAII